jgi:hypothetical protein
VANLTLNRNVDAPGAAQGSLAAIAHAQIAAIKATPSMTTSPMLK